MVVVYFGDGNHSCFSALIYNMSPGIYIKHNVVVSISARDNWFSLMDGIPQLS